MLRRMVEANTKKKVLWMRGKRRSLKRRIQNCIQYFVVGRLHKELLQLQTTISNPTVSIHRESELGIWHDIGDFLPQHILVPMITYGCCTDIAISIYFFERYCHHQSSWWKEFRFIPSTNTISEKKKKRRNGKQQLRTIRT